MRHVRPASTARAEPVLRRLRRRLAVAVRKRGELLPAAGDADAVERCLDAGTALRPPIGDADG